MKQKIKEAIETTLVVENKQSIDLCVDKIFNSIQEQKKSDAVEFATYLSINNWESSNGIMYNKFRNEYGSKYIITTEHIDNIYKRFLTSKTK